MLTIIEWGWAVGYEQLCRSRRFARCGELRVNRDWCRTKPNSWSSTYLVKNMLVWIKKSQKKCWFKQRRNLWRKIKYQFPAVSEAGLFTFSPNTPGKTVTLLVGNQLKELQLQRKEISVASEADKRQSGAKRTNHRAALKFEKCAVSSCVLIGLLQFSLRSRETD